jgi:hypothetical protein
MILIFPTLLIYMGDMQKIPAFSNLSKAKLIPKDIQVGKAGGTAI